MIEMRTTKNVIDIAKLKTMNTPEQIAVTKHAKERLLERNITIADIVNGIATGEIIKQYEDDKPLGSSVKNRYIHIVVSHDVEYIYLITAYFPDLEKWENGFRTRKEC